MSGLIIYSKSNCPRCVQLKQIMEQKGILYSEVSLDDPVAKQAFISAHPTVKSLPFVAGNFINFR